MFHAASMGGMLGVPGAGRRLGVPPAVRPGAGARAVRGVLGHADGDGADDDRHADEPSRVPARAARDACAALTYGASPMPAALLEQLLSLFPDLDVFQGYGMTESSAVLTALGPTGAPRRRPRACARPDARCPGSCCRSRIPAARCSRRARPARCAPGPATSCGSTGSKPEATADAFRDGWYHSGDAGLPRRRRLPVPRRPGEGHDRHRRRERVLGRGRERDRLAPARSRRSRSSASRRRNGARPCTRSSWCATGAT